MASSGLQRLLLLLAAVLGTLHFAVPGALAWKVGFGYRNASPSQAEIDTNQIFLGGFGILGWRGSDFGYARGVNDEMAVSSWFVESETEPGNALVLAVLDTVGIGNRLIDQIREEASRRSGLPASRIVVSATHTHAGPDLQGLWAGVTATYRQFVVEQAVGSILDAVRQAESASLWVSSVTPGEGFTNNRRGWGFTLNTTTILQARSRRDPSRLLGNLVNFAAHPTTLGSSNLLMSADYPFWLRKAVTRLTNGAPTVFVNGPIGDVTARSEGSGFERPEFFGEKLASLALSSVGRQVEVQDRLRVRTVRWFQPVTNPIFQLAFASGLLNNYYKTSEQDGKLGIVSEVVTFSLGRQVTGASFPGEALTRTALPVRELMQRMAPHSLLFGLSQDTLGYLVPSDEWNSGRNGGYEELISVDQFAGDHLRDRLRQALGELSLLGIAGPVNASSIASVDGTAEQALPRGGSQASVNSAFHKLVSGDTTRIFASLADDKINHPDLLEALHFVAQLPQASGLAETARRLLHLREHTGCTTD